MNADYKESSLNAQNIPWERYRTKV